MKVKYLPFHNEVWTNIHIYGKFSYILWYLREIGKVYDIWTVLSIFQFIKLHCVENNCREHINRIKNNCSSMIILLKPQEYALQWNVDIFFNLKKNVGIYNIVICWLLLTLVYAIKIILRFRYKLSNTSWSYITLKCWN